MQFTTHNDAVIETSGTSLRGYIDCFYSDLVDTFGYPLSTDFLDHKTDAEWNICFEDGTRATIYNWKNGKRYLGAMGLDVCDIAQWHIGGFDVKAVELVTKAVNEVRSKAGYEDVAVGFQS